MSAPANMLSPPKLLGKSWEIPSSGIHPLMNQWSNGSRFFMRYPLVDGKGKFFGSMDGDSPPPPDIQKAFDAYHRILLSDKKKDTVVFALIMTTP
ncbi:MAG: hypothetical protein Ct9H300mP23_07320 [Nitrospinota bacterium]|nr:MAG: hypothetical protein Ct9H300mP23_07320 [Nitrospinota bacterium]